MKHDMERKQNAAETPQNANLTRLHFRQIDWKDNPRPRLHDLLLELEAAENTGRQYSGLSIFRNGAAFILAGPWLAVPAARLAEAMQAGEVKPDQMAAAILPKPGKFEIAAELLDETANFPETDRTRLLDRLASSEFTEAEIRAIAALVDGVAKGGSK